MSKKFLALLVALLAWPAVAQADVNTPAQATQALGNAETSLAQPASVGQLKSEQAQVQPAVDMLAADNPGEIKKLINKTNTPGSPAIHAAILADTPQYQVTAQGQPTGPAPTSQPAAIPDPCWGANDSVYTRVYWGGIWTAGWLSIVSSGWCGNGWEFTYFPGYWGRQYTAPGYCFTSESWNTGDYIAYWWWTHGGHWGQIGVQIPIVGCASLSGGGATLREWSNGYWDTNY